MLNRAFLTHFTAFASCDEETFNDGYREDAVMVIHSRRTGKREFLCKGPECVRTFTHTLFWGPSGLCDPKTNKLPAVAIDNTSVPFKVGFNLLLSPQPEPMSVFIQWAAPTKDVPWATDTFVYDKNWKISFHSVYLDTPSMGSGAISYAPNMVVQSQTDAFYRRKFLDVYKQAFANWPLFCLYSGLG